MSCSHCRRSDVPLYVEDVATVRIFCSERCQDAHVGVYVNSEEEQGRAAMSLLNDGYAVVRVYDEAELGEVRDAYAELMHGEHPALPGYAAMPEYRLDPGTRRVATYEGQTHLVKGGFGALGNPSSFHAPIIRRMRRDAQRVASGVFSRYLDVANLDRDAVRMEQLVDRARLLRPDGVVGVETWHRDQTPMKMMMLQDDLVYGGWLALDGPQRFSAIRGSHRTAGERDNAGFSKVGADDAQRYTEQKNAVLEAGGDWFIFIPAGHMLIFQQEMVHEVVKRSVAGRAGESYRLFTAWRLTRSRHSFIADAERVFERQSVPLIKSGQAPPMFSLTPWTQGRTAGRTKLAEWSRTTFQAPLLHPMAIKSGVDAGETHMMAPYVFFSLFAVAVKLAAQAWLDTTDATFRDQLPVYRLVRELPSVWMTEDARPGVTSFGGGHITPALYMRFMYEPYTADDRMILSPMRLK